MLFWIRWLQLKFYPKVHLFLEMNKIIKHNIDIQKSREKLFFFFFFCLLLLLFVIALSLLGLTFQDKMGLPSVPFGNKAIFWDTPFRFSNYLSFCYTIKNARHLFSNYCDFGLAGRLLLKISNWTLLRNRDSYSFNQKSASLRYGNFSYAMAMLPKITYISMSMLAALHFQLSFGHFSWC